MLLGLRHADELGILSIVIESDSLEIIQAIQNPSEYQASGAMITNDCRKLISSFGKAIISHCVREANGCAHELACFSSKNRKYECGMINHWIS